jgi:O-antigen/teichoic acid export membrane protein
MVLARLLTPAQFGVVAGAAALLAFLEVLYEQGFGDALVQRPQISQEDVNGVFYVSVGMSLLLTCGVIASAGWVTRTMGIADSRGILMVGSLALPITAASVCQQALYRRSLDYKWLALRSVVATSTSGVVGVACAFRGFGAWSLVVQGLCAATVNTALLWARPLYRPTGSVDWASFRKLLRYSSQLFVNRLVDFGNVRLIDFLIVLKAGPAALGIYSVGSRMYLTAMLLLSSVILDVAHSGFSRLAREPTQLLSAYYRAVEGTAALAVPVFFILAAASADVTVVLFGMQWADAAPVMHMLCLVGALQCIQFYNGTCFNATGRPSVTLTLNAIKVAATSGALILSKRQSVGGLVEIYALVMLANAPLSFALSAYILRVSIRRVVALVWPFVAAAAAAYLASRMGLGGWSGFAVMSPGVRLLVRVLVAGTVYLSVCLFLAGDRCRALIQGLRVASRPTPVSATGAEDATQTT